MGTIRYLATDEETLNYNAMQLTAAPAESRAADGVAYTLSKSEGSGLRWSTKSCSVRRLRERYYGPPSSTADQITGARA